MFTLGRREANKVMASVMGAVLFGAAGLAHAGVINSRPVGPLGDNDLQDMFSNLAPAGIYVSGPVYDAVQDQSPEAVFTSTASGGSIATFVAELSVAAGSNRFGLYDHADPSKKAEIFGGSGTPGNQTLVSFLADGTIWVSFVDTGITNFSGRFGFYVDVYEAAAANGGDGDASTHDYTVYTDDSLNPGGAAQALVYQGNDSTDVAMPGFMPGTFSSADWIIGFEDGLVGGASDEDYSDLVVYMESLEPPAPFCGDGNVDEGEECDDGNTVDDDDCSNDCTLPLSCRVTGGGVDSFDDWDGTFAKAEDGEAAGTNRYTFGGQAGAPTGSQPQPWGEWTHHQQRGPDGMFVFHAGTASAPPGTEIDRITCSDPGWCVQARPAPNKQIDFEGVGTFKNMKKPSNALKIVKVGESLHWFSVHIEDLGEPGKGGKVDPPAAFCPAAGSEGVLADCDCPDFYRITIHANTDPGSTVIYSVYGYIKGGNLQIHPSLD